MLNFKNEFLALGTFVLFLGIWESISRLGWVDPIFISSPSEIFIAAKWLFAHGLWEDIKVSLGEFIAGMTIAIGFGVLTGFLLGRYSTLNSMFSTFITMLNSTPRVALLPIIILWLGIGMASKVAAVFLGAYFPIVISTMQGVRTVDDNLIKCARSFGATDHQIFSTIVIPSCVPFIVGGLHIAVGRGLVGVVIGEFLASRAGIGHMMAVASGTFQTDKVFVGVFLLTSFGFAIVETIKRLEKKFDKWRI